MFEIPALLAAKVAALIQVISHGFEASSNACVTTNRIMNVSPGFFFNVPIANVDKVNVSLSKQ